MTTIPTASIDVDALRTAYATRDAAALLALYADDATVEIIDALNPPSTPRRLAAGTPCARTSRTSLHAT